MKKTGIAIGVLLAVGAVATGGAWYTGQQLEGVLRDSLEKGNAQLAEALPGENVKMEMLSFERGFFSSQARYRVSWGEADASGKQPEFTVLDNLQHGPFPLSRVAKLKLLPVMAVSSGELERNELLEPIFKAAEEGSKPVVATGVLGYDRSVSGTVTLAPFSYADEQAKFAFSGLALNYDTTENADKIKFDGSIDKITFELLGEETGAFEIQGVELESDRVLGESGFYNGTGLFSIESANLTIDPQQKFTLKNMVQRDKTFENGSTLGGALSYEVSSIHFNDTLLGSATMDWSIADFDVAALKQLSDVYNAWMLRFEADSDAELSQEEQQQVETAVLELLAGKPKLALDNFTYKSANAKGELSLKLGFAKPESLELPSEEMLKQLLASLDLRVAVDKALIIDVAGYQALFDPSLEPTQVTTEATMLAEMAAEMAVATQAAKLEKDTLVSTLSYANGTVNFNGKEMPVEEFLMLLSMVAPAGLSAPEGDDESYYEEESVEESDAAGDEEVEETEVDIEEQADALNRAIKAQDE